MNVLDAFLGYKSETCLPKSKCLKSMPISIFLGGVLVNVWGVRARKSAPELYYKQCLGPSRGYFSIFHASARGLQETF